MNPISLIIHGGAGDITAKDAPAYRRGCVNAAQIGWSLLQQGASAIDAVEAAVKVLEDDATFDAGRGSYPNQLGEIEMDAILMDGATLKSGAVAGIQRVRHPITVARLVMEQTRHSLLVGAGAEAFARKMQIPVCPIEYLLAPNYRAGKAPGHDTVGVIARDAQGHLAVGTSTGGMAQKLPGRVGDSPLIGSGAYADDLLGAASATGVGEDLMKLIFSKLVCDLMGSGFSAQAAVQTAVQRLGERVQGVGGAIAMNAAGEVGFAYNTPGMARAWFTPDGELHSAVFEE